LVFLSCDWGTSALRLRLAAGQPPAAVAEVKLDRGAARVHELAAGDPAGPSREERFASVLREACRELARKAVSAFPRRAPIVISGMAGSSIGWREVPYADVPFPLDGSGSRVEKLPPIVHENGAHDPMILGGLRKSGDVMRGEETEVLGLFSDPDLSRYCAACLLVLPGTHSKHVLVIDGRIRSFTTYMTGELFATLQETGILRHSIARAVPLEPALEDDPALEEALRLGARHSMARALSGTLFQVRTNALLGGMDPLRNRWFLSGLLIGAETRDAFEGSPPGIPIVLAAGKAVSRAYTIVFETIGDAGRLVVVPPELVESAAMRGQALVLDARKGKEAA